MMRHFATLAWIALAIAAGVLAAAAQPAETKAPGPVPATVRQALNLSPFYKKHVDADGLAVLGSEKVSDAAMVEAAAIVNAMLGKRDDIRRALIDNRTRIAVMAPTEMTTDIPEHGDLTPKDHWDRRARGLGATRARPASSCAEENLLNLPGDRYARESIAIHEFAHTIHILGLNSIDPSFEPRLRAAFQHARDKGLWTSTYAGSSYGEYWAEGVQSYFDANDANNAQHNDVNTREKLAAYDAELFALVDQVFGKTSWRYVRYDVRHGRAPPPDNRVTLAIANRTDVEASIYWSGPNGEVLYRKLAAGQAYEQKTFVGHKWQAKLPGRAPIDFVAPAASASWILK
jgi:alpha-glucosidase